MKHPFELGELVMIKDSAADIEDSVRKHVYQVKDRDYYKYNSGEEEYNVSLKRLDGELIEVKGLCFDSIYLEAKNIYKICKKEAI